jgi:hypothetical protein
VAEELFRILGGLLFGSFLGYIRPKRRWIAACVIVSLGVAATVASGEYLTSWDYLLVDIPLVGLSTAVSAVAVHRWRWVASNTLP